MLLIYTKLKQAREMVGFTQAQLAEYFKWANPTQISQYEMGKKKRIPEEYFQFLIDFEFDMNTLFDNSISTLRKKDGSYLLSEPIIEYEKNTTSKYIEMLEKQHEQDKQTIDIQRKYIKQLQNEISDLKGNTKGRAASA